MKGLQETEDNEKVVGVVGTACENDGARLKGHRGYVEKKVHLNEQMEVGFI